MGPVALLFLVVQVALIVFSVIVNEFVDSFTALVSVLIIVARRDWSTNLAGWALWIGWGRWSWSDVGRSDVLGPPGSSASTAKPLWSPSSIVLAN